MGDQPLTFFHRTLCGLFCNSYSSFVYLSMFSTYFDGGDGARVEDMYISESVVDAGQSFINIH